MEYSFLLLEKILALFLVMLVGFVLARTRAVNSEGSMALAKLSYYVYVPVNIFLSFQTNFTEERLRDILWLLLLGLAINLFFILLARLLKTPLKLSGTERACIVFSNAGGLLFPLIAALLGNEYIALGAPYVLVQNLIVWTYGQRLICGDAAKSEKISIGKLLCNPMLISLVVALLLYITKLTLPSMILSTLDTLSGGMSANSMLLMGLIVGGMEQRARFVHPRVVLIAAVRLLLCPLLVILLLALLPQSFLASRSEGLLVLVLAAAAPTAVTVVNITKLNGVQSDDAVAVCILTDLLCLATMPVMISVYQALCG